MPRKYTGFKEGFWAKVDKTDGCWLWTGALRNKSGYGNYRGMVASRVAWTLVRGEIPDGKFVLHKCDNPLCVNPEHLFIGTKADNAIDMMMKDRHPRKLSKDSVFEIRELHKNGTAQRALASKYGVSPSLVCRVVSGKQWAWTI